MTKPPFTATCDQLTVTPKAVPEGRCRFGWTENGLDEGAMRDEMARASVGRPRIRVFK
jgi:hypothetical protein